MLARNSRESKGYRMHHPDQEKTDAGKIVPNPVLRFVIKSKHSIIMESEIMQFHRTIEYPVNVDKVRYNETIINFKHQCAKNKVAENAYPHNIAKNFFIMMQSKAISDRLNLIIDLRSTALSYAARKNVEVDPALPPQKESITHSVQCGSAEADMTHLSSHGHLYHREDNS